MRSRLFAALAALAVSLPLLTRAADPRESHPPLEPTKLGFEVFRVIDGDTVQGDVFLPWGQVQTCTIRALGYDAWESSKRRESVGEIGDDEVKKGKAAARGLQEVFDLGTVYVEPEGRGKHDAYGRYLARLWVKTDEGKVIDVAAWMRKQGHCRPDKEPREPGHKPVNSKPVVTPPAKPKASGASYRGNQRQAQRPSLDQMATQPLGLQIPEGAGGFGGYEPQCQKTRAQQVTANYKRR